MKNHPKPGSHIKSGADTLPAETCDQKENFHCFNKSWCGMQAEGDQQQMQPSEIAVQPASDRPFNMSGAGTAQRREAISRKLLPLRC